MKVIQSPPVLDDDVSRHADIMSLARRIAWLAIVLSREECTTIEVHSESFGQHHANNPKAYLERMFDMARSLDEKLASRNLTPIDLDPRKPGAPYSAKDPGT